MTTKFAGNKREQRDYKAMAYKAATQQDHALVSKNTEKKPFSEIDDDN